jgi:hypothetical protein
MIHKYTLIVTLIGSILTIFDGNAQNCIECTSNSPLNNGLIFCAPMQGNADDVTSSPLIPSVSGGTALTSDRIGNANNAYDFSNISTSKIKYNTSNKINLPSNQSLSMSVWFFARSTHANPSEFFRIVSSNNSSFEIFIGGTIHGPSLNKKLALLNFDGPSASSIILLQTSSNITLNTWHHTVVTVDKKSNTTSLYLDGLLVTSKIAVNNALSDNFICIGNHETNAWGFDGKIDDARVYNRALDSSEVKSLYEDGTIKILTQPTSLNLGDSIQVFSTPNATSYLWAPVIGINDTNTANPTLKPQITTTYFLTAANGTCTFNDSITLTVNSIPSSIVKLARNIPLSIYPNPSNNGIFEFSIGKPIADSDLQISIYNQLNQLIASDKYTVTNKQLDISCLDNGLYFVQFSSTKTGNKTIVKVAYW